MNLEMWWAQTTWSWPVGEPNYLDVSDAGGRLEVRDNWPIPFIEGHGFLWWSEETYRVRVLQQFWLGRDRMAPTSLVFLSEPRLEMKGILRVFSGPGALFDSPSISAHIRLRQTAELNGSLITALERRVTLLNVVDDSNAHDEITFQPTEPLPFPSIYVALDGSADLLINLEVELEMRRDGDGWELFDPLEGESAFWLAMRQWQITESSIG
jgi:hypothetical protein